jgi:pimeloyl-ACP methyl ester carboxylesterase
MHVALPNALKMAYDARGSGVPLVLLHAFPLARGMWAPQLEGLSDIAKVIAPDLRGFGETHGASRIASSVEQFADDIALFADALGLGKIVLGGLSMGGYVALAFARRHPGRLLGLVLANTRAEPDDEAGRARREQAIALVRERGAGALFEQMEPAMLTAATRERAREVVSAMRSLAAAQSSEGVVHAIRALRDRPDARDSLRNFAAPTLVLVGEHDTVTPPSAAEYLAGAIDHATLVRIPDAAHLSNVEQPDAWNAAVRRWLEALPHAGDATT